MSAINRERSCFSKISCILILLTAIAASAHAEPIHLQSGVINPEKQGKTYSITSDKNHSLTHRLVQFENTTDRKFRENLETDELQFISYIPENAWLVKIRNKTAISELQKLDETTYVGPFKPEYRASNRLKKIKRQGRTEILVEFFSNTSNSTKKQVVEKYSAEPGKSISPEGEKQKIELRNRKLDGLMKERSVRWIEKPMPEPEILNDASRSLIDVNPVQNKLNLNGSGFTGAEWDGGWAGRHTDLNQSGKLIRGDAGCTESDCSISNHATHVAGTMLGSGILESSYRGVAPASRLITYEWPTESTAELFHETNESINRYNAVLSQNSWGYGISQEFRYMMGNYRSYSRSYDSIISQETSSVRGTLSVIFAAGNEGNNWNPRYNTTTGPGATAKNTITVGAVDDTGDMTSYSSWGPTDDGRIKPDVVADGGGGDDTQITSTVPGNNYGSTQGTSMAAPAVSGAVLLLNQQFSRTYNRIPEPATVKALLIHNTKDLGRKGPDYKYGWGLVNTSRTVKYARSSEKQDLIRRKSLGNREVDTYNIKVPENESVKITLVWSDYPSSTGSAKTLVNDIDLKAYNNGEKYLPWTLNWSTRKQPATRNQEDHTNNVEQVYIPSTTSNNLSITVEGNSIPQGPQNYSLVLTDKKGKIPPEISVESPENNTVYQDTPDFNLTTSEDLEEAAISVDGENISLENTSTKYYNRSLNLTSGQQNAVFYARNSFNITRTENISFRIDREKPGVNITSPDPNENISEKFWVNATWNDKTTEVVNQSYRLEGPETVEGVLNSSLNASNLKNGVYSLEYSVQDLAGNLATENRSITIDTEKPYLDVENTENFTSGSLRAEAVYYDNLSGLKTAEYILKNNSTQKNGSLNSTIITSEFEDRNYSLEYLVSDYAGNTREKIFNLKIDNTEPRLNVSNPENNSEVSGTLEISASWSDSSPVAYSNYSILNNSGKISSGSLNNSVNSTEFSDGNYTAKFEIKDKAGNNATATRKVSIQNPPVISINKPGNSSYSELESINISSNEALSSVDAQLNSKNLSLSKNSSYFTRTDFNLSNGSNSLEIYAEDLSGNTASEKVHFSFDNVSPKANISVESSKIFQDWYKDSVKVEFTCTDRTTSISGKSVNSGNWSRELENSENTTEISRSGKNEYIFRCTDSAGNIDELTRNLSVDTEEPVLKDVNPGNNSVIPREKVFTLNFTSENNESGLNMSSINTSVSEGSIENLTSRNSSAEVEVSGLDYGSDLEVNASLSDNVGHEKIFELVYSVESRPQTNSEDTEDDSGAGGGSSGGFQTSTLNQDSGEETENTTEVSKTSEKTSSDGYTIKTGEDHSADQNKIIRKVDASEKVEITVSKSESGYSEPENTSKYSELNISKNNSAKTDLNIGFAVNNSWFKEKNVSPESTSLYRRNDSRWQKLETRAVNNSSEEIIFESEVPGSSIFTIAAEKTSEELQKQETGNRTASKSQEKIKKENTWNKTATILLILLLIATPVLGYETAEWLEKKEKLDDIDKMKNLTDDEQVKSELIAAELSLQNGDSKEVREKLGEIKKKL